MRPTSVRMLLAVAVATGVIGWLFADWVDSRARLPAVPWLAVLVIWVIAGFVGVWAAVTRKRLNPDPPAERMAPLVAARTAALALAGSRVGAVIFGLYGGLALRLLQETAVAAGRERLLAAALASLGGFLLAGLSLWLERICRLPDDPEAGSTSVAKRRPRGAAGTADGAHA